MDVPSELLRKNAQERGPAGLAWAEALPEAVAACTERWGLRVDAPFSGLSYNYAAPAALADGRKAVLKLCFPDDDFRSEAAALAAFDGVGVVRLLEADLASGAMLLERVEPGTELSTVADDEVATAAAAEVMRRVPRQPPPDHRFRTMAEQMARSLARCRPDMARRGEPEPAWLPRALAVSAELRADGPPLVLLHGDLHHHNVLAATRVPWLAIDPHGVLGEPADEPGPWVENRADEWTEGEEDGRRRLRRMIDQLAEALELDRQRLRLAVFVRVALSEMWTLEGNGPAPDRRWGRPRCLEWLMGMV